MSEDQRVELRGLNVHWDGGRTERLLTSVEHRVRRRQVAIRAALASAALISATAGVALVMRGSHERTRAIAAGDPVARTVSPGAIRLRDGSEIRPAAASEVRVVEETASHVLVELVGGAARYSVVPNPARTFEVHSGSVSVRVVGTEFVVDRRAERTWVEVVRGKVAVSVSGGGPEVMLATGESGLFPRATDAHAAGSAAPEREPATPADKERASTGAYRARVAHHDYGGAFALLARDPTLAGSSVEDLLLAADVARLSEHPAEAVPYLQRVIREHPGDERAPLAAFTLGRTLNGLGRTREAMSTFGRVRSDWPKSALAEDALLRQAEAASKLGELGTAVRLAKEYEHDYPNGRRRGEIRNLAHLE
jgi:transmembrane sensor